MAEYKIGGYKISDLYQGGYSTFEPPSNKLFSAGSLGLTTNPQTANQIAEVNRVINTGAKTVEITGITPAVFETMPNQQLKEINRLAKLTGVDITVHGILVEPSGLTRSGFSEAERESVEKQMIQTVERSLEMNPQGNFPVTFHSSNGLPGRVQPKGKAPEEALIVNTETGAINQIPLKQHYLLDKKPDTKHEINQMNEQSWHENLKQVSFATERANEFLKEGLFEDELRKKNEALGLEVSPHMKRAEAITNYGKNYLKSSYDSFKKFYDVAYENVPMQERDVLDQLKVRIQERVSDIEKNPKEIKSFTNMKEVLDDGLKILGDITPPQVFRELEQFSQDKTSTTFGNVAFESWRKHKDNTPIISIENPPVGMAFATGEDLKNIVVDARKKFVERATAAGYSESQAQKAAEKTIGVTWDVGHINMLKKYGYDDSDIVRESEKIAPFLKHVHLSDNFGFEHTELPMGMGNVPLKEITAKLGAKAEQAKKIIETGSWYQYGLSSGSPPFLESLEGVGSPIYGMKMAPYWTQTQGLYQGYQSGYGQMLPQVNYETFGAGFSRLPQELGGSVGGAQGSRMSGRPME